MNTSIITDLELAASISQRVSEHYRRGIEFITALPDYSLVQFRCALEALCEALAVEHGVRIESPDLRRNIDSLLEGRAITFSIKDSLHSIRKRCNVAAHKEGWPLETKEQSEKLTHTKKSKLRDAAWVRDELVSVLAKMRSDHNKGSTQTKIQLVEIKTQEWKDILFEATINEDADNKYTAGLWCEAHARDREFKEENLIVSNEFDTQSKFLRRLAASLYKASDLIKPNLDARFRYASLVEQGLIDRDTKQEAIDTIKFAADSGLGTACDYYAVILYESLKDYEAAQLYWEKAAELGIARAYYCLGLLHLTEDFSGADPTKAIAFYQKGIEEEDPDSYYGLGACYFKGTGVEKSVDKSRHFLEKAINLGHPGARTYLAMHVNGGIEQGREMLQFFAMNLLATPEDRGVRRIKPPRPNEPCLCGSGIKFKKCCGKKAS